ncbi:threonine export protein RhtC [Candidatus Symbiopectobacterium sp.]|uniref:threonine export protein RhtC n=1 Tax=Candidatus Symbiopectobacterium sp. TaxID=2816440 RepID=UPI0025BF3C5B|nr:threonine export protein RhtC [Candidatus Symbiopectobacterium sp.]
MMLFLTVAMVHFVALMSPGQDFFFVSPDGGESLAQRSHDGRSGYFSGGVMVWAAIALMGLHLLLQKMAWLHDAITIGGGLYLCWMGRQMLRATRRKGELQTVETVELPSKGKTFIRGLLTNLVNPKALIYFGSVFSLFVGDSVGTSARWGLFALISLETLLWFSLVAMVFALPAMRRGYQRLAKWIDGLAGGCLPALGYI